MQVLTVRALNDEMARRGYRARLLPAENYFYFWAGEAADWIDRTVNAPRVNALSLGQWIGEFERLRIVNREIAAKPGNVRAALESLKRRP